MVEEDPLIGNGSIYVWTLNISFVSTCDKTLVKPEN